MSEFQVVIPARMGSARLPGKPLLEIGGVPMVVRVARQAALSGASSVIVATDDRRIFRAVAQAGQWAAMTAANHPSGSDRVQEVVDSQGWGDRTIVLNVQGDEPLIPPQAVRQLAAALAAEPKADAATLCAPIENSEELADPSIVKLVRDRRGRALYFSRSPHSRAAGRRVSAIGRALAAAHRHLRLPGRRPAPVRGLQAQPLGTGRAPGAVAAAGKRHGHPGPGCLLPGARRRRYCGRLGARPRRSWDWNRTASRRSAGHLALVP